MLLLLQIKVTPFQAGVFLGAILGALLGLIPLILGIVKKRVKIGVIGFIGAIATNPFFGVFLSVPIVALCVYLILKKNDPVEVRVVNDAPIDVKIDRSENS